MPKLSDLLQHGIGVLERAGIDQARLDAELLLGFCLDKSRTALYLAAREPVASESAEFFLKVLSRRAHREPLSYITGEREFWSLPFTVSPAVLIPRPETEFLLETVLAQIKGTENNGTFLDLCCGSGVIAVVLARELGIDGIGLDISRQALLIARHNCIRHRLKSQITLVQADLFSCFTVNKPFSLIVSNPPYVCRSEIMDALEPEVADYEPHLALDGGESGLDVITAIRDELPLMLDSGGDCFLEIGDNQGEAVKKMFQEHKNSSFYERVNVFTDYSGRDRVVHIRRNKNILE